MDATHLFEKTRLVPVVTMEDADLAVPLAELLRTAGFGVLEVTLRTPAALAAIAAIVRAHPG